MQKDAYDIYCCVRNYPGGPEALVEACQPLLEHPHGNEGYARIAEKFATRESYGPVSVSKFVADTDLLGDRSADQWQTDAFGQVNAFLKTLGTV